VLRSLQHCAGIEARIEQDPARMRAADLSVVRGNADRARHVLGWLPRIPLETTLRDVYDWWYGQLRTI
jgi:GDP-4-dehydro-6-deoxy-D-mannose reductase